jgi:RHS repeat-associated protein
MMKYLQSDTGQARGFLYDADDERIMTFDCAFVDGDCATEPQLSTTIRGLDGKVLRIYNQPFGGAWNWERDYVYRDGQLLASVEPRSDGGEDTVHFHLDHLGSPRQITDELGVQASFHTYYPFGGQATDPSQDDVELKFTGHERDENGSAGAGVLDYMHARYFSPNIGRFLSIDPVKSGKIRKPQSWNRYSYAVGNPIKYLDPDGRNIALAADRTSRKLRLPLVRAIQRPSFRASFIQIATTDRFTVNLSAGEVANRRELLKARMGEDADLKFARGLPKVENDVLTGVDLTVDLAAVALHPSDRTGVKTLGHEFDHLTRLLDGLVSGSDWAKAWQTALEGDLPDAATGPSALAGGAVFNETPDLTRDEAREILERYLQHDDEDVD